jgi:hypothetical protein
MRATSLICSAVLAWSIIRVAGADAPPVKFDSDGTIRYGDKMLSVSRGHLLYTVGAKTLMDVYPHWSAPGQAYGEAGYDDAITAHAYDAAAGEYVVTATLPKAGEARYEIRVKVLADGLVNYRIAFADADGLASTGLQVRFPGLVLEGTTIRDEGRDVVVEKFTGERQDIMLPQGFSPEFFAENPDRAIRLLLLEHAGGHRRYRVSDGRQDRNFQRMEFRPQYSRGHVIEMNIDIRRMSEARRERMRTEAPDPYDIGGVAKVNRMELPNFAASRNLIQNPSVEEGMHAWDAYRPSDITEPEHLREWCVVDSATAYHGKRSFRFQVRPSSSDIVVTTMSLLTPYSIQLQAGKKYVFSFYAKAETEGLVVGCTAFGKAWGKWLGASRFALSKEWTRHSITFTPEDPVITVMFGIPWWDRDAYLAVKETTHFWADAFQLEEGEAPTAFTVKPLSMSALGVKPYYAVREAKPLAFEIQNNTDSARTVDCAVSIRDFFKNEIAAKAFPAVQVPPNGSAPILVDAAEEMNYIGYYTVRISLADQINGYADHDFFPVAVIEPFSQEENARMKHRLLFALGNMPGGDRDRNARVLREVGVGALQPRMYPLGEAAYRIHDDVGLLQFTGLFGSDPLNMYVSDPGEKAIIAPMWHVKSLDAPEYQAYLDFLENVFLPKYRHFTYIKYFNEPHRANTGDASIFNPKTMAQVYRDVTPIIRRAIPGVTIISSDPANIGDSGRTWLDEVFMAGGGDGFDILAGHPYREKPERPDLEHDTEAMIAIADRHGFRGDIWFTEAGNHPRYIMPGYGGVEPRNVALTSDMPGARKLIAYNIRYIIMTMKYADRVKMFLNWKVETFMNFLDGMPGPVLTEYNAVARRLGNASFVRDFSYGDGIKAYGFDDGAGRGVAAIWDCDDAFEDGERAANRFRLHAKAGAEVTDLFGRALKSTVSDGDYLYFDIDYTPSFIIAPDVKALVATLEQSGVAYDPSEQVAVRVGLQSFDTLAVHFKNRGSSAFAGHVQVNLGAAVHEIPLSIQPLAETTEHIPLADTVDTSTARYSVPVSMVLADARGKTLKTVPERRYHAIRCGRRTSDIRIDGDLGDWDGLRFGEVGKDAFDVIEYESGSQTSFDDLGARFSAAWDEDALYLAIDVWDDVHHQPNTLADVWDGDSVQLFIDAFGDGQETSLNQQDDYEYLVASTPAGDQVFRALSPDRQLSWLDIQNRVLEPDVEVKIRRDEANGRTVYELRFPAKYVAPVALRQGNVIGLGLMVNDADGGKRQAAITTCDGKEGWMKPYNLSFFVFE